MTIYMETKVSVLKAKCQVSVERIVLDLESEAMRGPGSIPTGGNVSSLDIDISVHMWKNPTAHL